MRSKKLLVAAVGSAMLLTGCVALCDGGVGFMCNFPAYDHWHNRNFHKAKEYTEKGCQLDDAVSCNNLGALYAKGYGVPKSDKKAFEYFEKGCNLGSGWACGNVGEAYFYGKGVKKSKEAALQYFEMAMKEDEATGYYGMGLIYEDGYKVEQSYVIAAQLYQKACDNSAEAACYKLGRLFERGKGVTQSYLIAKTLYSKACNCEEPDEKACERLAYINKKGLARKEEQAAERAAEAQQRFDAAQRKAQGNAVGNVVDQLNKMTEQSRQHTQNMLQIYENSSRNLQTNTIQPMNFNKGPEVYYGQRINDNMMSIRRVR